MAQPGPRRPTRAEFRKEVLAALRAAGFEGPFESDAPGGHLLRAGDSSFDLREAYDNLAGMAPEKRAALLESAIRGFVDPPSVPTTWDEAKDRVRPSVKSRINVAADEVRHLRGAPGTPHPASELTAHLVLQLVVPQSRVRQAVVSKELLDLWGVAPDVAFRTAIENVGRASARDWRLLAEAPGVYFSSWDDGFDASRLALPGLFTRVSLKGRPVALAPSGSALAFAGSDDEEGLFHLARMARRLYDRDKTFLFLRPIRLAADGVSWEDWLPPKGHGAYEALRLLSAFNEVADYAQHAQMIQRAAQGEATVMSLAPLDVVQSIVGGETLTITRWKAGGPCALPKADAVIFEREGEVLGHSPWDTVSKVLWLEELPGYPPRYYAPQFPEDWQLGPLDLKPWRGS